LANTLRLKRSPFAGKDLTNYFIQPSLLLSGGMIIFSLATKGSLIMFSVINAHGISSCPHFSLFAHWRPAVPQIDITWITSVVALLAKQKFTP